MNYRCGFQAIKKGAISPPFLLLIPLNYLATLTDRVSLITVTFT